MPTTNFNKKGLVLKRWEPVQAALATTTAGTCTTICNHIEQKALHLGSTTTAWLYTPEEDGFVPLASPALAGTFGAGVASTAGSWSIGSATGAASLTATGGTVSTIVTNQTLAVDLRGFKVHILSGPNAGATLDIVSNTTGTNATITVATQASAFTASTVYRLCTPVWYVVSAGTTASGMFKKYDYATNTWTTLVQTGLPASIGNDSTLTATPSFLGTDYSAFATGTATAGGASTLTNSAKTWTTNQWTNYQIRIVSGTGAGQIRTIASNTGAVITTSAAWTTQPSTDSVYSIEGNDDFIYYMGNAAVGLIRYSISANTWTTLTPTAARAAAPSTGMSGVWVNGVSDSDWTSESAIINGRRIYSFRGGAGALLDYYDIALNTWVSGVSYAPNAETFTTGTKYAYYGNCIYIQKDATLRWYRFNIPTGEVDGWTTINNVTGTAIVGNTAYIYQYRDGATIIPYVYFIINSSTLQERQMVI